MIQQKLELSANNVTAGDQLNASCTTITSTVARSLYVDGQPIEQRISGSRLITSQEGSMMTTWIIYPVQRGDGGEYVCFVSDQIQTDSRSPPQNVIVYCEFQV